ncbi:MAG: hypothetical protein K1Y02_03410 [Candidatus Hydrogenedentes bacterium]|nr:hypothetical protein [Candidatus Hydrogenedentota bacterium]
MNSFRFPGWRLPVFVSLCALTILALLVLRAGAGGTYAAEISPERRNVVTDLARRFSDAVVRLDVDRAYALLSTRGKETMTREQFDKELQAGLATFTLWDERPIWIEVAEPTEMPDWYGVPKDIDAASMEAWVVVTVGIEKNPPEGIEPRPCDLYLLLVADEGGLRIGTFSFEWCD